MALTNVIQEPRRELTETGLGVLIFVIIIAASFFPGEALSRWFCYLCNDYSRSLYYSGTLVGMIIMFFIGWFVLAQMHNVGERFADNLANRGLELRGPRRQNSRQNRR